MNSQADLLRASFDYNFSVLSNNLGKLTLHEALFTPPGGYRSILGTLKHTAAWAHVYRSFAFDAEPRGWYEIDWPYGLRDRVVLDQDYLGDVLAWINRSHSDWMRDLATVTDADIDTLRQVHWGDQMPLWRIVVVIGGDYVYHAGEINQLLSIYRKEAWETGEEVEENHISTVGHRVRPPWLDEIDDR